MKKGKLKLTFHLPHKYFWQALLAFRLPSPRETGPAESLRLCLPRLPSQGTWGTLVVLSQPQHRGRRWHSRKKHGVQLQDSLGDQPWGSHRAGAGCAAEPELCPQVPVLSPATSLPNAWFSSSLKEPGQGGRKGCESCPRHSAGSRVSQGRATGRCHSGRTLLSRLAIPSSGHKISSVPFPK